MRERSRRGFLAAAGAGALALGPGAALAGALDREKGSDEPGALTALITAELNAAFAYDLAGNPKLAAQEGQHAKALASLLDSLGRAVPVAPRSAGELGPVAAAVARGGGDEAAIALERVLVDGCARALAKLGEENMIRTVATVMASHAQHRMLLEHGAFSSGR